MSRSHSSQLTLPCSVRPAQGKIPKKKLLRFLIRKEFGLPFPIRKFSKCSNYIGNTWKAPLFQLKHRRNSRNRKAQDAFPHRALYLQCLHSLEITVANGLVPVLPHALLQVYNSTLHTDKNVRVFPSYL